MRSLARQLGPGTQKLAYALGSALAELGSRIQATLLAGSFLVGVFVGILVLAVRPSSWKRTVREVLVRQMLFTGVESVAFCLRIAAAAGIMIVVQAQLWTQELGGAELLGPLFLNIIVRELGPLLANFLVIVRSGTAITTELGNMRLAGEVEVLDSQGLDPMKYLVLPRVIGVSLSVFCLGVLFVATTFVSGYVVGALMGLINGGPYAFFGALFDVVTLDELYFFLPKTLLSGVLIGVIATTEGLSVRRAVTEVPQAASRSAVRCLTAVFVLSAVLSLLVYGRILIFRVI